MNEEFERRDSVIRGGVREWDCDSEVSDYEEKLRLEKEEKERRAKEEEEELRKWEE